MHLLRMTHDVLQTQAVSRLEKRLAKASDREKDLITQMDTLKKV